MRRAAATSAGLEGDSAGARSQTPRVLALRGRIVPAAWRLAVNPDGFWVLERIPANFKRAVSSLKCPSAAVLTH